MAKMQWHDFNDELDDINQASFSSDHYKKNTRAKKRKWREIEQLKEKYRLEKELLGYQEYGF